MQTNMTAFYCVLSAHSEGQVTYYVGKKSQASLIAATFNYFNADILCQFSSKQRFCVLEHVIETVKNILCDIPVFDVQNIFSKLKKLLVAHMANRIIII